LILLIRHASAGDRAAWEDDDRLRPLDKRGRKQAERLVDLLARHRLARIVSSPYLRCVQTVEPLAKTRGLAVDSDEALGEALQETAGRTLVASLVGSDVAVCCHGGLAEALVGRSQKKAEAFVLDPALNVVERIRP
jgi:8-oxo-dGTP diphosphatase